MRQITITADNGNTVTLGDRVFTMKAPIEGVDTAPIRTSSFDYTGRDGGEVPDQNYSMRRIGITGTIVSSTCPQHDLDRRALRVALPIRQFVTVTMQTFGGLQYEVQAKVIDFKMPIIAPDFSEYKIDLLCPDSFIYELGGQDTQWVRVDKYESGGYITPYVLPVVWQDSQGSVAITNTGDPYYPVIKFKDSAQNPIITNETTDESFRVNVTMIDGDELIVDMRQRTITLNGGSVLGLKDASSVWWQMVTGDNVIALNSSNSSDNVYALVGKQTAFSGV